MKLKLHHTQHEEDALSKQNMLIDNAHHKEIQTERRRGILIVIYEICTWM